MRIIESNPRELSGAKKYNQILIMYYDILYCIVLYCIVQCSIAKRG